MKKGISQKKVQRMRNLATKNYGAKTSIQSGYGKKSNKHIEGDIWEERGKSWTIKNGIRQSITKLDSVRDHVRIPPHCPKCNTRMNRSSHKFMYSRFKHCLFCQTKFEINLRKSKEYDDWKNESISNNFDKWLKTSQLEFEDWIINRKTRTQIAESGMIEDWSDGQSDEELRKDFDSFILAEKENLIKIMGEKK